jgi:hypothetical protein
MKNYPRKGGIIKAEIDLKKRIMLSVPLTGLLRAEWVLARYGQALPCNWNQMEIIQWMDQFSPLGFLVADARNVAAKNFIDGGYEWLFFIDHDVVMPINTFNSFNKRMLKGDIPVFGGLYFTKSVPSEPLVYKEFGASYATDWKLGDEVWVKGMGLGCNMIHRSIMEIAYKESEWYKIGDTKLKKVFDTPDQNKYDAEHQTWQRAGGTEDLTFYNKLVEDRILVRAGWGKFQKKTHPFLCDTKIFCRHIDWNGITYPANGEEKQFEGKK